MDHKNNTISEAFNRRINIKLYYIINPFDSFTDRIQKAYQSIGSIEVSIY